mmetsp:Transcript_13115/g.17067  ORF Transcript_13115/g.17067 Transcript_13115/m.17067 type:complete len:284 (-) Transcript_13115:197-1048(-)|eukprot:CAMPEP_0184013230 /NCGR_PEP_ID=MMETSP0954-20121128/4890_1 /TAXON_ID=627963 /ORGANISM="Aplanochytrium sp, Strain PBS07" /LENGTH=283 /DNA_ID=CAMNT_0026293381 /DNA_START=72 /DNA_END=923 /DNA_ORIENTATION=-
MSDNSLPGVLHKFGKNLHAFESGAVGSSKVLVFLGGLTDGLFACSFVPRLSRILEAKNYALIQPILRSSYNMFGTGTLDRDSTDLSLLFTYLLGDEKRSEKVKDIKLLGHSTGCQIAVHYCLNLPAQFKPYLQTVILQAPVSDRDALPLELSEAEINTLLERAKSLIQQDRGKEIVYFYDTAPVSGQRFLDLFDKGGKDDMFSSDLTDSELRGRLGHMDSFKTLIVISLADEYVPKDTYPRLGYRLKEAIGVSAELLVIKNGDHSLTDKVTSDEFINYVLKYL